MNISWDDARLFLAIAETGSFSAAARQLDVAQPTISRRIAELEYQLGWSLFHRGKRGTTLSEDGARLVEPARQMARWAAELQSNVAQREKTPEGKVRVTAAPGIAFDFLLPFCDWFRSQCPDISIELLANTNHLDLARGDADLALRTQRPTHPELALLTSVDVQAAAFARPEYVASLPDPCNIEDVKWITWCSPMNHITPRPQLEQLIPQFQPAFSSDNFLIQQRACEIGLGALLLGDINHPLQRRMGLKRINLTTPLPSKQLYLVSAKSLEHVPRIRAVANALTEQFKRIEKGDGTI